MSEVTSAMHRQYIGTGSAKAAHIVHRQCIGSAYAVHGQCLGSA
jgi:hypothetical protein